MASLILPSSQAALKLSQILSAISLVLGGIALILDIIYLVQVSIHIHDGSQSDVAKKMEEVADVMDAELFTVKRYMLQISMRDRDEDNLSDYESDDGFYDSMYVNDHNMWTEPLLFNHNSDVQSDTDSDTDVDDVMQSHDSFANNQISLDEEESECLEAKVYPSVDRELYRLTPRLLSDFEDVF